MSRRQYRFFYHFNKPATQQSGEVVWSVHFRGRCYLVRSIQCSQPTQTKTNRRQPRGVVQGHCSEVLVRDSVAVIQ